MDSNLDYLTTSYHLDEHTWGLNHLLENAHDASSAYTKKISVVRAFLAMAKPSLSDESIDILCHLFGSIGLVNNIVHSSTDHVVLLRIPACLLLLLMMMIGRIHDHFSPSIALLLS